jgi:hypothetical protein
MSSVGVSIGKCLMTALTGFSDLGWKVKYYKVLESKYALMAEQ